MLTLCNTPSAPIELSDSTIEISSVIRLMLDLIHGKPFVDPPSDCMPHLVSVALVLKKYECSGAIEYYKLVLRSWAANICVNPKLDIFCAAAHMDDIETCVLAIARGGSYGASSSAIIKNVNLTSLHNLDLPIKSCSPFDLSAMSFEQQEKMPGRHRLALMRATRGDPLDHSSNWQTLSQSFKSILT